MRDRFPGYYRPTPEEFKELWEKALVVPDTNVLLTLYRLTEATRAKLLEILSGLQERLFVPYQVGMEFQRNRLGVIDEQMRTYEQVEKAIAGVAASVGKDVRQHPRIERSDLEARIEKALAPVQKRLEELREGHPDPLQGEDPLGADVIRDALGPLLEGRIGEPRELESIAAEGRKRYERKQPPGWKDKEKPEPDRYGDLAIWLDVIAKAKAEQLPVIFVTEERKPDWWSLKDNKTIGPQPALVEEMRAESGQALWLYNLERFMEEAAEALGIEFSKDEREDVVRAETATVIRSIPSYPLGDYEWKLDRDTLYSFSPQQIGGVIPNTSGYRMYGGAMGEIVGQGSMQPLPGTIVQRWVASAAPDGASALLRVEWQPQLVGSSLIPNRMSCMVTDAEGNSSVASRRDTTLWAAFRYPDNFAGAEKTRPGSYTYSWFYGPAGQEQTEQIASGEFELSGEADEGPEK